MAYLFRADQFMAAVRNFFNKGTEGTLYCQLVQSFSTMTIESHEISTEPCIFQRSYLTDLTDLSSMWNDKILRFRGESNTSVLVTHFLQRGDVIICHKQNRRSGRGVNMLFTFTKNLGIYLLIKTFLLLFCKSKIINS